MNRAYSYALVVAGILAFIGYGCQDARKNSEMSKVDGQAKKTGGPESAAPTRAQAIIRVAKLGGRTAPPAPTPSERVLLIDLSGTQASDADLRLLLALPELQHLDLSGTKITDDGLKHVAAMKDLSSLKLNKTALTCAGLGQLRGLPQLGHIEVTGTEIQESDLARLTGMKSLRTVLPFSQNTVKAWLVEGELVATAWASSRDKVLSLRLLAPRSQKSSSQVVVLLAELRNESKKDWVVLRPLADEPRVRGQLLSIRGPAGPVPYVAGEAPTYVLSDAAFAVLRPGQVIRDQIELPVSLFKGLDVAGEYSFTLKYSVSHAQYQNLTTRIFPEGKPEIWTGELSSKELKVTLSQE